MRRKIVLAPNFSKPVKSKIKKEAVNSASEDMKNINGKIEDLKIEEKDEKIHHPKLNAGKNDFLGRFILYNFFIEDLIYFLT